jgi:hypothetical protein
MYGDFITFRRREDSLNIYDSHPLCPHEQVVGSLHLSLELRSAKLAMKNCVEANSLWRHRLVKVCREYLKKGGGAGE